MPREPQDVTESELTLLHVLWDRGRSSTRQLTDVLYPRGRAAQYATVQKLLERLEGKGLVRRDRSLFVHTFEAVGDRYDAQGNSVDRLGNIVAVPAGRAGSSREVFAEEPAFRQ